VVGVVSGPERAAERSDDAAGGLVAAGAAQQPAGADERSREARLRAGRDATVAWARAELAHISRTCGSW
jgi:hypothetical protein